MENNFYEHPILNSPYKPPARHWELDDQGQPTQRMIESRRSAEFITPIPKPRRRREAKNQQQFVFDEGKGLSTQEQQYDVTALVNEIRRHVDQWRTSSQSAPMGRYARNRSPAPALATPPLQRHPALLLPGGGGRDGHLAHRGCAQVRADRQASPRPPRKRQQRRQPGSLASGLEAGHRRWQDYRHGYDHRMADHQRRPAPQQQALHAGFPGCGSRHHHQGQVARASAQRPRQLLRQ